ncbi:GNAT family N-acetyltransferase [Chryseobacterium sp.]|uniref:GNAT family N-acetyltransferase n=1 Tax=Chryseobacterium sp. TaxID=1871047 RepID=UPI0012AA1814|nr:GNAT family N-acetyltransferase [Chryseobacterium sp.]QFG53730.1 GNAT family N-acetyltransferase [Chryseobacterium sp.]
MFEFIVMDTDSPDWDSVVRQAEQFDFHHTSYFHQIDNDFQSKLLYFKQGESFIALPIVIRPIPDTDYFDITSVYGYAGPIYKFQNDGARDSLKRFFREKFIEFCRDLNIVSVFSRLHPLISQADLLTGLGKVIDLNKTVAIDLTISPEEQRRAYRKSLKSELNQLRRKSYRVQHTESKEEIEHFISVYYETMDRVEAGRNYYFNNDYFLKFLNNPSFDARLLVALDGEKVIAGAIFTFAGKIMQYHLAGTSNKYISDTPMKLILDEARLIGNDSAATTMHLGGGVGGQDDDSLFRFKSGFSKKFKQFSIWNYIVNEEVYQKLSAGKESADFFPLYRL